MTERFQMIDGVMRDTHWVCRVTPLLPNYRKVEVRAMEAVLWRWHTHQPFPYCSRFPTTRAT